MPQFAPFLMLAITVQRVQIDAAMSIEHAVSTAVSRLIENRHDDRGQATTEYALVLLAAALVALLVVAWATAGGGAARINSLFNRVIDSVIDRV
jgi:hypothetical protein